jgi:hypothetical protein
MRGRSCVLPPAWSAALVDLCIEMRRNRLTVTKPMVKGLCNRMLATAPHLAARLKHGWDDACYYRWLNANNKQLAVGKCRPLEIDRAKWDQPQHYMVNMVDSAATFASPAAVDFESANAPSVAPTPMNVDDNVGTSSAITNIATVVGRDHRPAKKRRGRINSSNPSLRDKPVTSDAAYELVETDENDRAQKQSDKIRARVEREDKARQKEVAEVEEGVKLKPTLEAMPDKSAEALSKEFKVDHLKALIRAFASVPTKGKKDALARQLATLVQGRQGSAPLLLMDRR